jgi:betaine-aldehyde dehydrogenase
MSWKIAPALLAGCTVVLKSAPEAPVAAYLLAEVAEQANLPAGVLNIITAEREVSEELVRHPGVDKISFTGSTAAGKRIAAIGADRVARVNLELGGKSAALILDDYDIAADSARDAAAGNQFDANVDMGPVAMKRQLDKIHGLLDKGREEGAKLAAGGHRPSGLDVGWFIEPTVLGNVDNHSTIARNEIFGPVLSVIPAANEQDQITIANDSIYGLNSAVFTNDENRAWEFARQIRSGTVGHNAHRNSHAFAFGGFKQSGIGREGGREGLMPYLETKAVILDREPSRYV